MLLLSGHSLTPARKVPLETMSLRLNERESSASMVPVYMTGIGQDSWFQDDTNPGKGIVWRVKSTNMSYSTDTPTVELEHIINTLKDRVMFGEHTAANISGGSECTAEQAVRYILSFQSDWVLGSFGYSKSAPYKFDGDTLFDALEKVSDSLDDPWWSFDTTKYPFVLSINQAPGGTESVLRPGRNLTTITKTVDRSGMYTRVYPIGKDDLHIPGDYVSRNEGTYGVVCKVVTDTTIDTVDELIAWANDLLKKHAQPTVRIVAEGMELADATGENLDRMTLGRKCMIPLTEFDTTITERITELNYPDKIHQKEIVQVTMENTRRDVTRIIAEAIKQTARGGRGGARQQKQDHAWFEDTDDHVAMCAVGIIGTDEHGNPNWTRLSRLEVNEDGIFGEVQSVLHDVVVANTRIDQNENEIKLEAKRAIDKENSLSSRISVQANQISLVVEKKNGKDVVKSASIITAINQDGSSIKLSADKINLSGYVTMSKFTSLDGTVQNLKAGNFTGIGIRCGSLSINSAQFTLGVSVVWKATIKDGNGNDVNVLKWG